MQKRKLVTLPPLHYSDETEKFNEEEQQVYDAMLEKHQAIINSYLKKGTLLKVRFTWKLSLMPCRTLRMCS